MLISAIVLVAAMGVSDLYVQGGLRMRQIAWVRVRALAPSVAPLVVSQFDQGANGIVIPAQLFFGPAAFAVTAGLHRRHTERTTSQWLAEQAARSAPMDPGKSATVADARTLGPSVAVAG